MVVIEHKINDYVSIICQDAGKVYDFKNKEGKQITGTSKEQIKIKTPYGSIQIKPNELLGIWAAQKNADLVAEVKRRADHK